jgi:acyl-CoA synthetase (AMP-forming)/AMP-acid ligase II
VVDCLVVGVPDDTFGHAVTAVVSLADGASVDSATIISSVKNDLAGYKAPKSVFAVARVPRAPKAKADYRRPREHAEAAMA